MKARALLAAGSLAAGVSMGWVGVAHAASSDLLGDYAFTGSGTCIAVKGGDDPAFDDELEPKRAHFVTSFTVQGTRTFHGDGTGIVKGKAVSASFAQSDGTQPSAESRDFTANFTYKVSPEGLVTIKTVGYVGTIHSGPHAGETVTIDRYDLAGFNSVDNHTITFATPDSDRVETYRFWARKPGAGEPVAVEKRICHRSRVGTWTGE